MSRRRLRVLWIATAALLATSLLAATAAADETSDTDDGSATKDRGMPDLSLPTRKPAPFRLSVGPLVGARSMTFEGDSGEVIHKPKPYLGAMASASGLLATFDKVGAYLTFDANIGYGITTNTDFNPDDRQQTITEMSYGGGRIYIKRPLSRAVTLGLGTGLQATSFILEPNSVYTGHRYFAIDTALHARWHAVDDFLSIVFDLGAYPVFATNNSDNAHGESTSFGVRGQTDITLALAPNSPNKGLRDLYLVLRYRYQRYRSQFPVSPIGTRGATSRDNQHIGGLMMQYSFGNTHE